MCTLTHTPEREINNMIRGRCFNHEQLKFTIVVFDQQTSTITHIPLFPAGVRGSGIQTQIASPEHSVEMHRMEHWLSSGGNKLRSHAWTFTPAGKRFSSLWQRWARLHSGDGEERWGGSEGRRGSGRRRRAHREAIDKRSNSKIGECQHLLLCRPIRGNACMWRQTGSTNPQLTNTQPVDEHQ